jgi:hypothetical protein
MMVYLHDSDSNSSRKNQFQALYVMISCAVVLDNLVITCWFPSTNVNRRLSQAYRNEFDRLEKLDQQQNRIFKRENGPLSKCVNHNYHNKKK